MFIYKFAQDEFLNELENNLDKSNNSEVEMNVLNKLDLIAENLDDLGFDKEANAITHLMEVFAKGDPATKNLTYGKMVKNLKNKGWIFNADDGEDSEYDEYWYGRGVSDARKDKGALFRFKGEFIVPELDNGGTDDWTDEELQNRGWSYLAGYDSVDYPDEVENDDLEDVLKDLESEYDDEPLKVYDE